MVFEQATVPLSLSSSLYEDQPLILVNKQFEQLTGLHILRKNAMLAHTIKSYIQKAVSLEMNNDKPFILT